MGCQKYGMNICGRIIPLFMNLLWHSLAVFYDMKMINVLKRILLYYGGKFAYSAKNEKRESANRGSHHNPHHHHCNQRNVKGKMFCYASVPRISFPFQSSSNL